MDRAAPPWHALEEPSTAEGSGEPQGRQSITGREPGAPRGGMRARHWALVVGGVAAAVALAGAALVLARTEPSELTLTGIEVGATPGALAAPSARAAPGATGAGLLIAVDVGGAVQRPGVYRLPAGSRIADAIAAAGGYSPRVDVAAASDRLNLAAVLADGERVRVPARGEPGGAAGGAAGASGGTAPRASGGPVDQNRATAAELEALPGIGPVTAAKIIAAREGTPFTSVDDLRTRGLVGPATFAKIKALVAVGR